MTRIDTTLKGMGMLQRTLQLLRIVVSCIQIVPQPFGERQHTYLIPPDQLQNNESKGK
jgi:hypothetical protein